MSRHHLLGAVSVQALALLVASSALAQQSLPTIEVGGAQGAARQRSTAARNVSAARVTTPAGSLATSPDPDLSAAPGFSPQKLAMPVYRQPTGQTFTAVRGKDFENMPLVTVREMLQYSPGVSFKQGNGPRDIVISIRGSSARNGFGVRNIVVLEDGFDRTWVASANNVSNSVQLVKGAVVQNSWWPMAQNATGSIYAGNPRLFQGGVKFKFDRREPGFSRVALGGAGKFPEKIKQSFDLIGCDRGRPLLYIATRLVAFSKDWCVSLCPGGG